ncbi:MAG: hypothetical protein IT486_13565 [Gammaproteobacteria bacterium]|nr:hypothetical protein [Gammaproteobacteria bacterium]
MNKRRQTTTGATPAPRDQTLRLAVAATTLGMTMGIAPAAVLGADEAPVREAPSKVQDDAATTGKAGGAYMKYDSVDGEARMSAPGAAQHKFEKIERPAAGNAKVQAPPAAGNVKGEKPPAAIHKGETSEAASQKAGQASGAGRPTYDLATGKK